MSKAALAVASLVLTGFVLPHSAHAAVGRTAGIFDVSSAGAATYRIPIWVPPGPNGVQPNLALAYNSQAASGIMGPGWSLSGLSSIARCNKTVAQDGTPAAVQLVASDGYCLDGNRLRLAGGTYSVAGSTYQTEIADFSLVTAQGSAGNGPASFIVQRKDGLIFEYGNSADSRILASGTSTAIRWLLSKVRDRAGNNYVVIYGSGQPGSVSVGVPLSISYAPTSAGATTYSYSVTFAYGPANSATTQTGYVAGSPR